MEKSEESTSTASSGDGAEAQESKRRSEKTQAKIARTGVAFFLQQMRQSQPTRPDPDVAAKSVAQARVDSRPSVKASVPIVVNYGFAREDGGALCAEPVQIIRDCFTSGTTPQFGFSSRVAENNYVRTCKWSPNGKWLVADAEDRLCRIFRLGGSEEGQEQLSCHSKVRCGDLVLDWQWLPGNADDNLFATTSKNQPIHLWDTEARCQSSFRVINPNSEELVSANSLAFSLDGRRLYAGYYKAISTFDMARPGKQVGDISTFTSEKGSYMSGGQKAIVSCIAMCPTFDGVYAAGSFAGNVGIYSEQTGQCDTMLEAKGRGVTHISYSSDGCRLFVGCRMSPVIECFDLRKLTVSIRSFRRPCRTNQRVYFEADATDRFLFSGSTDGEVMIYDLKEKGTSNAEEAEAKAKWTLRASSSTVAGVSLHPKLPLLSISCGQRVFPAPMSPCSSDEDEEGIADDYTSMRGGAAELDNAIKLWRI